MKRFLLPLLLFLGTCSIQAQIQKGRERFELPKGITAKDYLPGIIIIKFKESANVPATLSAKHFSTLKSAAILSISRKFPEENVESVKARPPVKDVGLNRVYEIKVATTVKLEKTINELLADPRVEYAEPAYIHHTHYNPNDPRYLSGQQPYLGIIRAPQAWDLVQNSTGIIIGIVDSGSELTHPDLAANIYYNSADPVNGSDDDGDGFVDNYAGWDFVGTSGTNIQPDNNPNVVSANNQHGIHVSGIASAVTDNGVGLAATSFNAKLLIIKAGPDDNGEDIYRGYEGIKYAADKGAHIINCSWGSTAGGNFGRDIVNYAIGKGCLIVAAAGNSGSEAAEYPAAYKNVIAVANTDNNDVKATSSSFGQHVTISAPGTSILSTTFNNTYGLSSGTSMASPVVASAAALVKRAFPQMSMQEVGELLRITADNIDTKNTAYQGKIGKGRLNVLRALTETPPSIRIQNIVQSEKNSFNGQTADTLYLYLDLKNFLSAATGIQLNLSTENAALTILDPQITVASINRLETKSQIGPLRVLIPSTIANNTSVQFTVNYTANGGAYQDYENFSLIVAKDYIDINTPSISTTVTSNGRIGFSSPNQEGGQGFVYKGEQLLYEAALMIGNSSTKVSNNARAVNGLTDEDFVRVIKAHELVNNTDSVMAESQFNDAGNSNKLNILVTHKMRAYKAKPNDKYVIAEYEISNLSNIALTNVHVGLFTDWDILGGSNNATQFDATNRLAYVYDRQQTAPYAGVKLLSQTAAPVYYPLTYRLTGNPLSDNDFTTAEKWETLSSGVKATEMGTNGTGIDVSFVSGLGPYNINANSSIKVAFAIIGADNLQDLKVNATAAQQKYDAVNGELPPGDVTKLGLEVYPNPIISAQNSLSSVRFFLPQDGIVSLDLVNLQGQTVRSLVSLQPYLKGLYTLNYDFNSAGFSDVESGVYIYKLNFSGQVAAKKLKVLR